MRVRRLDIDDLSRKITMISQNFELRDSNVQSLESGYWDNNANDILLKKYLIQCLYDI
jgi:hypothetical protein